MLRMSVMKLVGSGQDLREVELLKETETWSELIMGYELFLQNGKDSRGHDGYC